MPERKSKPQNAKEEWAERVTKTTQQLLFALDSSSKIPRAKITPEINNALQITINQISDALSGIMRWNVHSRRTYDRFKSHPRDTVELAAGVWPSRTDWKQVSTLTHGGYPNPKFKRGCKLIVPRLTAQFLTLEPDYGYDHDEATQTLQDLQAGSFAALQYAGEVSVNLGSPSRARSLAELQAMAVDMGKREVIEQITLTSSHMRWPAGKDTKPIPSNQHPMHSIEVTQFLDGRVFIGFTELLYKGEMHVADWSFGFPIGRIDPNTGRLTGSSAENFTLLRRLGDNMFKATEEHQRIS